MGGVRWLSWKRLQIGLLLPENFEKCAGSLYIRFGGGAGARTSRTEQEIPAFRVEPELHYPPGELRVKSHWPLMRKRASGVGPLDASLSMGWVGLGIGWTFDI